jgi:uncharacterized membrane protein
MTSAPPPAKQRRRSIARGLLAIGMVGVGVLHFVNPAPFVRIVPAILPAPYALVLLSGAIEIALGVAVLVPRVRRLAGFGLVALYLAVFPANINMAMNGIQLDPAHPMPAWLAWARLPLQLVLIALALWATSDPAPARAATRASSP